MNKEKLTTVKVNKEDYLRFKQEALKDNFTFKKLVDKVLVLYLSDSSFKKMINEN